MTERLRGGRVSTVAVVDEIEPEVHEEAVLEPAYEPEARHEPVVGGGGVDPLYPVALLKLAMALKKLPEHAERHLDALLDDVLRDMIIDRADFDRYLRRNMGRLMRAVRSRGY